MNTKLHARTHKALYAVMLLGLTLLLCSMCGAPAAHAQEADTGSPAEETSTAPKPAGAKKLTKSIINPKMRLLIKIMFQVN